MNEKWLSVNGLINSFINRYEDENAPLYTMEYLWMIRHYVEPLEIVNTSYFELVNSMGEFIWRCKTDTAGLYDQRTINNGTHEDYMSPDQLMSFVSYFHLIGSEGEIESIWKYLKRHFFTYDNLGEKTNFKRTMQPGVVFFAGVCAGAWWLKPFLSLVCIISCMAPEGETSGKLKAWLIMRTLGMERTFKICTKLVKDWTVPFGIYFPKDHPINELNSLNILNEGEKNE